MAVNPGRKAGRVSDWHVFVMDLKRCSLRYEGSDGGKVEDPYFLRIYRSKQVSFDNNVTRYS